MVTKSQYVRISRTIISKLLDLNCFGKGSVYVHALRSGISNEDIDMIETVLHALIKQRICLRKKKAHGWKYFLNMDRYDKILEIAKERGKRSIIPIILLI